MTCLVDHAGGHIVGFAGIAIEKPLIIAHVLVSLETGIQNEDFAMLCRIHSAGVDVEIRIDFDQIDRESLGRKKRADGRRRHALAHPRHHSADDKNILVVSLVLAGSL